MTVDVTRLKNGLTIATDRINGVESAALGVWVGTGARAETASTNGVAHLLEHMAFKGTSRRSAADIAAEIEDVGGHLNAYTSKEITAYYARVLKEDISLALDILADILKNSVFDSVELDREREVILQEIGQAADTPEDVAHDAFQAAAYPGQPVGRPILGAPEIIRTIPRAAIVDYMSSRYKPGSMVLSAAGAVDHGQLVALAENLFGDIAPGHAPETEPAVYRGGEERIIKPSEQAHVFFGLPGPHFGAADYYAGHVLSALYGGGMSSRLFQEIREKRGLCYSIYSFMSSMSDTGMFGIYAGTDGTQAGQALRVAIDELKSVANGPTEAETDRAKAQLRASILMSRESTSTRAEQLAQQLIVHGRPVTPEEVRAKVDDVDRTAIASIAAKALSGPATLSLVGPVENVPNVEALKDQIAA
ncbi:MAG: pitrilysin family protein [Rhodospirillales bacterium]